MHPAVRHRLLSASSSVPVPRCASRPSLRRRHPSATRTFHASPRYRIPDNARDGPEPGWTPPATGTGDAESAARETNTSTTQVVKPALKDRSTYGSARRRSMRAVKDKGSEAVEIPRWFLDKNVKLSSEGRLSSDTPRLAFEHTARRISSARQFEGNPHIHWLKDAKEGVEFAESSWIIHSASYQELFLSLKAALAVPPDGLANNLAAAWAHLIFQFPGTRSTALGGTDFLAQVVKALAQSCEAELVELDGQDLAELGALVNDGSFQEAEPGYESLRLMSYDIYRKHMYDVEAAEAADEAQSADEAADEDEDDYSGPRTTSTPVFTKVIPITAAQYQNLLGSSRSPGRTLSGSLSSLARNVLNQNPKGTSQAQELKRWELLVEALLSGPRAKDIINRDGDDPSSAEQASKPHPVFEDYRTASLPPLIVHIRDYNDIQSTTKHGRNFISTLQEVIRKRRRQGQRIVIVGTESSTDLGMSDIPSYISNLQREDQEDGARRIVVTPGARISHKALTRHTFRRNLEINARHMRNTLRSRRPESVDIEDLPSVPLELLERNQIRESFGKAICTLNQVHRLTSNLLGKVGFENAVTWDHLIESWDMSFSNDNMKLAWTAAAASRAGRRDRRRMDDDDSTESREDRLKGLRKTCNTHEKKLLNGVVDADEIRTTFSDVHAPEETVEALKTLTTLSLIRPDAFTYGVLATDKIPGLLLYGPPGTGKTLLAKAVAKESGATVLEVSGSELYDMYVGEGEKNVKAVFSLAKKLAPCVVFIDEADAIFCSRTTSTSRATHRELINQFLKEWDGMESLSAFIMVATNRPFDLDDAVLRRLPRRVLVDLPTEKDREAILRIHLKDEKVADEVDIPALAARTPLYSGSDLKNLCVAAALACVREENDLAAKYAAENTPSTTSSDSSEPSTDTTSSTTKVEPYKHPEKRTLTATHFDKAMDEISASISEDMSSLSQIKKFDEKFGDRKGRRKKSPKWGFQSAEEMEREREGVRKGETGRVRN